jgi:tetratricopeptide (TPR) repeat protein
VPIDRAATLRNAEKLLRQGKPDQAIAEYVRVVEDQPRDWNTANILGDLYVRARKIDKAVEQFIRIADSLNDEGFFPKAAALYKKVLKIQPEHEHALLKAAEIAITQGTLADARAYLNTVAGHRRAKGDERGAAEIVVRLGAIDPADIPARMQGARARLALGDRAGAVRDLKELAGELTEKSRPAEALDALREAAGLSPDDEEVRQQLIEMYLAAGEFARARECAASAPALKDIAARLDAAGQPDEALEALRQAARLDPADAELAARLARAFVERGDLTSAADYLSAETAAEDPRLLLTAAEIRLRDGDTEAGLDMLRGVLASDPARGEEIAMLGWHVAEQQPEAGFRIVELAADAAVARSDWPSAAAALQEYVTRVPNHIPALMRLVEICVDGGLEATMYSAQAQLADAYIEAGSAAEARFLAEDLVAREPWDRANIERFRKALVLLGEPDPDALIAERLSGQSPFTSTDLFGGEELPELPPPSPPAQSPPAPADGVSRSEAAGAPASERIAEPTPWQPPAPPKPSAPAKKDPFELSSNAVDLERILRELDPPQAPAPRPESVEVDLSIVLNDIKRPGAQPSAQPPGGSGQGDHGSILLRDEASRRSALDAAESEYQRGVALLKAGQIDQAIAALETASRTPRLRFATATLLGRIFRERGRIALAIEWLERAAQAPAPSPEAGHLLLYDLADLLESVGETARALAICMELKADAGDFRDVTLRIERLSRVQAGG